MRKKFPALPGGVSKKARQKYKSAKGQARGKKRGGMLRIALPKDYSKWGTKVIACAERAIVAEINIPKHPANGLVARIANLEPKRPERPTDVLFHEFRLAGLLFPSNFMKVVGVAKGRGVLHGPALLSKRVAVDKLSKDFLDVFYDGDSRIGAMDRKFGHGVYLAHEARCREIAQPLAKKMEQAGIHVNSNPANVGFTKRGKPIFFEIAKIDLKKLAAALGKKRGQDSLKFLREH